MQEPHARSAKPRTVSEAKVMHHRPQGPVPPSAAMDCALGVKWAGAGGGLGGWGPPADGGSLPELRAGEASRRGWEPPDQRPLERLLAPLVCSLLERLERSRLRRQAREGDRDQATREGEASPRSRASSWRTSRLEGLWALPLPTLAWHKWTALETDVTSRSRPYESAMAQKKSSQ